MSLTPEDAQFVTSYDFKPDALCHVFYTPRLITGMVIDILRQHYASHELIEEPALRDAIFRDQDDTGILIQELTDWRPQNDNKRTSIIVSRGDIKKDRSKRSIGNQIHLKAEDEFAAVFEGTLELYCLANTGAHAELLATDVVKTLLYYHKWYKQALSLAWWDLAGISKINKLEEAQEHYCVSLTMEFAYYDVWTVAKDGVPIREINTSAYIE